MSNRLFLLGVKTLDAEDGRCFGDVGRRHVGTKDFGLSNLPGVATAAPSAPPAGATTVSGLSLRRTV